MHVRMRKNKIKFNDLLELMITEGTYNENVYIMKMF